MSEIYLAVRDNPPVDDIWGDAEAYESREECEAYVREHNDYVSLARRGYRLRTISVPFAKDLADDNTASKREQ